MAYSFTFNQDSMTSVLLGSSDDFRIGRDKGELMSLFQIEQPDRALDKSLTGRFTLACSKHVVRKLSMPAETVVLSQVNHGAGGESI
ncbi:hypothetical protein G6F68_021477 [Rhizopus microsporus]|nr:hypothetical protein G6F68_021477 [Rhizopus microsporus]